SRGRKTGHLVPLPLARRLGQHRDERRAGSGEYGTMHDVRRLLTVCVPVALAGLVLTACTHATTTAIQPSAPPTPVTTASQTPGASTPSASPTPNLPATENLRLEPFKTIRSSSEIGTLSPKSIVASGDGVVMAQNMIYNHTVTVFNSDGEWITT